MALVIQKYGGSSLANAEQIRNVATRIAKTLDNDNKVVAVVSAMGDTTDELMSLARRVAHKPDPRELDLLLSTGELVSCTLTSMALRSMNHKSISLSGAQAGIRTDTRYGKAKISEVDPQRLREELSRGNVVIVAGFQGISDDMDVTTLGRGASDLSAVAIAASLKADRCEVYTDVEGIYTADPKLVPEARKLDELGYEEMLELASYGAKMHPRSIEFGMTYKVPILVASSFTNVPGTLIHQESEMNNQIGEIRNRVRAIATDTNVAKITVLGLIDRPGIAASLFEPLAESDISVDVIVQNTSIDGAADLTFTVKGTELSTALDVVEATAKELGSKGVVSAEQLAKVSIVGTGMQDVPGYAARLFRTLAQNGINIDMITTSDIRITCIVEEEQAGTATRALHAAFDLEKPD